MIHGPGEGEAKFIYDSVTALLRLLKAMDAQKFEDWHDAMLLAA